MKASVPVHPREQRREPRRAAKGSVTVAGVRGELVDVSYHGFRVAHADASFEPGLVVDFAHSEASGKARVIWNRISAGRVETGFFIVERG